MITDNIAR